MKFVGLVASLFAAASAEKFLVRIRGEDIDNLHDELGWAHPYIEVSFDDHLIHTSKVRTRYDWDHYDPEFDFTSDNGVMPSSFVRVELWDQRFGDLLCLVEMSMRDFEQWGRYEMDCRPGAGMAEMQVARVD